MDRIVRLLLLVAATGVFQLKADGVPQSDLIVGYSEAREGQTLLVNISPSGSGSPAFVITPVDSKMQTLSLHSTQMKACPL